MLVFLALSLSAASAKNSEKVCRAGWVEDIGFQVPNQEKKCLRLYTNNGRGFDSKQQCRRHCIEVGGGLYSFRTTELQRVICLCQIEKEKSELDQGLWDKYVDEPFNNIFPKYEAELSYPGGPGAGGYPGVVPTGGVVLAEQILLRPSANWDTAGHSGLYTIIMPDVSLRFNASDSNSNMQWWVTNIPGNNISQGDEIMEYIPPIAFRNCWNGVDNHGRSCKGEKNGMIYDPDYTHQTVFWVFRQKKRITVEPGMRTTGCQLSPKTPEGSPVWSYSDIIRLTEVYDLTLHAGTFYREPYTPMVASILCQYHFCLGDLPFLAGAPGLPGITDRPECGPNGPADPNGNEGILTPIDWAQLLCRDCQ